MNWIPDPIEQMEASAERSFWHAWDEVARVFGPTAAAEVDDPSALMELAEMIAEEGA